MDKVELAAAALVFVNIALVVKRSIWNYPFGLAAVATYFFVFWEAKLYSDALLQIFFFVIQIYGWWAWVKAPRVDHGVAVTAMSRHARLMWIGGALTGSLLWGSGMARWTDAAAPFLDALVAGFSVSAQILQSLRRVESWMLWIAVNCLSIGLYAWRGLYPTMIVYSIFLIMAVAGLAEWRRKAAA